MAMHRNQPDTLGQDGIWRSADISEDGIYRWWLTRRWAGAGAWVNFLMLNPSTANATEDDATIRRVVNFARTWGFSGVTVTNLFAFRATDPRRLREAADQVGPRNDRAIAMAARLCSYTVCAWGAQPAARGRAANVLASLREAGTDLRALKVTRSGAPWHPLYVPAATFASPYTEGV